MQLFLKNNIFIYFWNKYELINGCLYLFRLLKRYLREIRIKKKKAE